MSGEGCPLLPAGQGAQLVTREIDCPIGLAQTRGRLIAGGPAAPLEAHFGPGTADPRFYLCLIAGMEEFAFGDGGL